MTKEFKIKKFQDATVYTLESATSGGTSAGSIASVSDSIGGIRRRGDNLIAQEGDKDKVDASKPRNFVAKNAKMGGAGAHKDKKKEQKQGKEKHKKPFMEDHEIRMASNELKSIHGDAKKLLMLVQRYGEQGNLEAWQQSKITKAADYLNSVLQSIGGEQGVAEGEDGTQTILSLLKDFVKTREEPEDHKIIAGIYKAFKQGMEPGFTALYNAWEFDIDADFYYFAKNKGVDLHAVADQAGFDTDSIRESDDYFAHLENMLNEDWQKVNKKDKTDGMSSKAVKAYRRENPGSKLKTAVTTKPSKLKKGSKSAKRRKSFCARMSGMKKAHAGAKTKRDPDSPINKALRRWNCEEDAYMNSLNAQVLEKLNPQAPVDTWVKDFQKADPNKYHQFKNKTPQKKAQMAVAARYAANEPSKKK